MWCDNAPETHAADDDEAVNPPGSPRLQPPPLNGLSQLVYRVLHLAKKGEVMHPRVAVFMIGLPGAGKSRVIQQRYYGTHLSVPWLRHLRKKTVVLDLDLEIVQHPDFDPADPDRLYLAGDQNAYKWADARIQQRFADSLNDPAVRRLVIDGTGTNVERQVRRMSEARAAGFFVKALYVRVPVQTAIERAKMRKRGVLPERIRVYQRKMARAMSVAGRHADEVEVLDIIFDDAPLPGNKGYVDPIPTTVLSAAALP